MYDIGHDILNYRYKEGIHIEEEDIRNSFDIYNELNFKNKPRVLLEYPPFTTISSEAREYAAKADEPALAEAMVIYTLPHRILARFYTQFSKKNHPLKIFNNRDKAIQWLREF